MFRCPRSVFGVVLLLTVDMVGRAAPDLDVIPDDKFLGMRLKD
jgi:hypothetical protein